MRVLPGDKGSSLGESVSDKPSGVSWDPDHVQNALNRRKAWTLDPCLRSQTVNEKFVSIQIFLRHA
jgi:hypothetical protein